MSARGGVIDAMALLVTALALLASAVVLLRTRQAAVALTVLLDMLAGAGLLRLAAGPTLARAAGAAGVLLVRQLVLFGLYGPARPAAAPAEPAGRPAAAEGRGPVPGDPAPDARRRG